MNIKMKCLFPVLALAILTFTSCEKDPEVVGKIDTNMVLVDGGSFLLGSNDSIAYDNESNNDTILVNSFYISKYEVSQRIWRAVMGNNPSEFQSDNLPVEQVSWYDCVEFCNAISLREGLTPYYNIDKKNEDVNNQNDFDKLKWTVTINATANGYRLPTEREWEFAARGGNLSEGYLYAGSDTINNVAWYWGNSDFETQNIGTKKPNELGLYDMSGNVSEWCFDWHNPYTVVAERGKNRAIRGGGWGSKVTVCRSTCRSFDLPTYRYVNIGFRLARSVQ